MPCPAVEQGVGAGEGSSSERTFAAQPGVRQRSSGGAQSRCGGRVANEFTAIVERDGKWFIAYAPEIPGANGQGKSREEALESLSGAISLILQDRREDGLRGLPPDATRETVTVK